MSTTISVRGRSAASSPSGTKTAEFISELPTVMAELAQSAERGNRQLLGRLAHQLKEAGEMNGYDGLTPFAARLERAAVGNGTPLDIRVALDDLIGKMRAMCAV